MLRDSCETMHKQKILTGETETRRDQLFILEILLFSSTFLS